MTLLREGTGGAPILDYAGPASRRALRLPAQSVITVHDSGPDKLTIVERLAGRGEAIGALLFAAFTLFLLSMLEASLLPRWWKNVEQILLIAALMGGEVTVAAMVINNTWRRTVVEVTPHHLVVTFSAPFTGRTRFEFRNEMVAEVSVIDTELVPGSPVVPEMEVRMWNAPPVRLFTGHRHAELRALAEMIHRVQPPAPTTVEA